MSTPHPLIQIELFENVLENIKSGIIKYFMNDIVIVNSKPDKPFQTIIKSSYCYLIDNEVSYLVKDTPIPFKNSEITLIRTDINNKQKTINYFNKLILDAQEQIKNNTWVSI